jgi:MORN repeat
MSAFVSNPNHKPKNRHNALAAKVSASTAASSAVACSSPAATTTTTTTTTHTQSHAHLVDTDSNATVQKTVYFVRPKKKVNKDESLLVAKSTSSSGLDYTTSMTYQGEWKSDRKHGYGSQTWSNGNRYDGEWKNGKRDGNGSMWVRDGKKLRKLYTGNWANGKKSVSTHIYIYTCVFYEY